MPVMEGKAVLFKEFAGVDAFPICLDTKDPDEIVAIVKAIAPTFGGINLEDISAPRCFEIEDRLKRGARHPGLPRRPARHRRRRAGRAAERGQAHRAAGSRTCACSSSASAPPGVAVTKILLAAPASREIIGCDSRGALHTERADYLDGSMNAIKRWFAEPTNPEQLRGGAGGRDRRRWTCFIGLSGARVMPAEALARMSRDAMVFAMANPNPEVTPEEAAPYVRIMATGRSDYPNQINNVLASRASSAARSTCARRRSPRR